MNGTKTLLKSGLVIINCKARFIWPGGSAMGIVPLFLIPLAAADGAVEFNCYPHPKLPPAKAKSMHTSSLARFSGEG